MGGNSTHTGRLTVRASLKQEPHHVYVKVYTAFEGDIEKRPTKEEITVRSNLESVAKRYAFVTKGSARETTVTLAATCRRQKLRRV
jgi:hypothetical protein